MHRRKKRKIIGKEAAMPLRTVGYPGRGALGSQDEQKPTPQVEGEASEEGLSFRVDLPSRRWLEQAAANSASSAGR